MSRFDALVGSAATEYIRAMPATLLSAPYDGEHIVRDEPFASSPDTPLTVAGLSPAASEQDSEREQWIALSLQSLARAYSDDDPEYTLADLRR